MNQWAVGGDLITFERHQLTDDDLQATFTGPNILHVWTNGHAERTREGWVARAPAGHARWWVVCCVRTVARHTSRRVQVDDSGAVNVCGDDGSLRVTLHDDGERVVVNLLEATT
jgi:hypothetical protein